MTFSKKKIYLAGPITGLTYDGARHGWRRDFANILALRDADHLECFSPMREKEFLEKSQCIDGGADYESLHGFGTPHGILTRDHNDVRNCDAMIACFLGATKVSIGTCVEFGFAHAYRKPVIMVMEPARYTAGARVNKWENVPKGLCNNDQSIGIFLRAKGHDIEGGRVISQIDTGEDHMEVLFTVAGPQIELKNPHDHVFLRACAGYVVPTLQHAADIVQSLLTPGL